MADELTPEEVDRRAREIAHRLLNTPPKRREPKSKGVRDDKEQSIKSGPVSEETDGR